MATKLARIILVLVIFPATFAASATTSQIKDMVVLGDSLSDQGNLFLATSVIGAPLGVSPVPASDHYYAGRFSNGENYAGQLAEMLGVDLHPSLAGGNNFAFGGARTTYNVVEVPAGPLPPGAFPWSLDLQREAFLSEAKPKGKATTLYVVFSGSNDIGDLLSDTLRGLSPRTSIGSTVNGIRNVILAFRSVGARNILVPNVPNLGLAPSVTRFGPAVSAFASSLAANYNTALDAMLDEFTDVNIIRFDTFALVTDIVAHPANYGFTNVTQPCYTGFVEPNPAATECATPQTYAFWDVEHPTQALHAIIASEIFSSALGCETNGNGKGPAKCAIDKHKK